MTQTHPGNDMTTPHRQQANAKHRYDADPLAVFKCLNKIQPFNAEELMRLELPLRMSFEALKNGNGSESDFHDMAAAINTTMVRSEAVDPLCEQTAIAARDALMRCWHRHERTGVWGFDGPALAEIDAGLDLHEQLIRNSTPLQMADALREVIRRGKSSEVVR